MNAKPRKKRVKLSKISALHASKLVFRSLLFLVATAHYLYVRLSGSGNPLDVLQEKPALLVIIWLVFAAEMLFRFFPSRIESMGCQKQFARNYRPAGSPVLSRREMRSVPLIGALWLALTGAIGGCYLLGWIDEGIVFLICLAFSVCDMICILFFCPFQTWFMKNKCCTSCRIYNWDYAMMFSPLIFIPNSYTWSLLVLSLGLLLRWEITFFRRPERFSEASNASLQCANCQEKLCHHKTQLQRFLHQYRCRLHSEHSDS